MAKSAWMDHMANFRKAHPGMPFAKVAQEAAKTYKKQSGGSGLAYSAYHDAGPGLGTSGNALQIKASTHGGSKKSHKSKSHKSKSHNRKRHTRKSHTRRHRRGGQGAMCEGSYCPGGAWTGA